MKSFLIMVNGLVFSSTIFASQWSADASIKQDLFYDDNVTMTEIPEGSFGYQVIPVAYLRNRSDTTDINAHASYGIQRYSDINGFDLSLQNYGVAGRYNTVRSEWGGVASLDISPARNTAARTSGNFSSNAEATTFLVAPYVSYKLTELDSIILSPRYNKTTYSTRDFTDSEQETINLEWRRQWTERFSSAVEGGFSKYKFLGDAASGTQSTSDNYVINLKSTYALTERWSIAGAIGGRLTESESTLLTGLHKTSTAGYLLNAGLNYRGENLTANVNYNRTLIPSSLGELQEQNSANLIMSYQLTERLTALLATSYSESTLISQVNQTPREYLSVQPGVAWRISPDWTATCIYRYRSQTIDIESRPSESNLYMLTLNYNWPGVSLSR